MIYRKIILTVSVTLLIFSGCMSVKPGTAKSGASLYETFFVGSDGTQYFINPLKFTGNNNDELHADFTFRYKDQIKDSVICNFSIISNNKLKTVNEATLVTGNINATFENITLLFNDTKGNKFVSRFSGRLLFSDFNKIFNTGCFDVAADHIVYTPASKTQKSIKKLRDKVFVLFD